MRPLHIVSVAAMLAAFSPLALAQFGGGFAPTKPAPPAPVAPPAPAAPASPAEPEDDDDSDMPANAPAPASPSSPTTPASGNAKPAERLACTAPEKGWVAKMDAADRAAIDERLGYALPPFENTLKWLGNVPSGPLVDGKVVVVQTFDVNSGGLGPIDRTASSLKGFEDNVEVVLIGVQVPNKAEASIPRVEKSKAHAALCVDTTGTWCDALGAYKKPVNFVVDKAGAIRYAGLNEKGLAAAVKLLLAEPRSSSAPAQRPETAETAVDPTASFPVFTEPVRGANDLRGKPSPPLQVDQWMTKAPDTTGKVIIVDFFFTGCAPCRAMIPHMNEIATHYGDALAVVGVSFENKSTYDSGLTKYKLKQRDFHYAIGLDSSRRTVGAFGVQSFPNVAVISADGIVRWQGHAAGLTQGVLDPIVAASRATVKGNSKGAERGWASK